LNTKSQVLGSAIELPRRWVLGVGALILFGVHYEAVTFHQRLERQFSAWYSDLKPRDRDISLIWLHGGLVSDIYSESIFGRFLSRFSEAVLYFVLWVLPVLTLLFVQAVVMPVRSEWLSSIVRVSLLLSVLVVVMSITQLRELRNSNLEQIKPTFLQRINSRLVTIFLRPIVLIGLFNSVGAVLLSTHVFLWPGEWLQSLQSRDWLLTSFVWYGPKKDNPSPTIFGYSCPAQNPSGNGRLSNWCIRPFEPTVKSTLILREYFASVSPRMSYTYQLSGATINGSNLTSQERFELSFRSPEQAQNPNFDSILRKVQPLDLSNEDLNYADLSKVFAPNVIWPNNGARHTIFLGANLQGSKLNIYPFSNATGMLQHTGLNISGGNVTINNAESLRLDEKRETANTVSLTAVYAVKTRVELFGPMPSMSMSDFRESIWTDAWFGARSTTPPFGNYDLQTKSFQRHVDHTTRIHLTDFRHATLTGVTWVNMQVENSNFAQSTLWALLLGENSVKASDFSVANIQLDKWFTGTWTGKPSRLSFDFSRLSLTNLSYCKAPVDISFINSSGLAKVFFNGGFAAIGLKQFEPKITTEKSRNKKLGPEEYVEINPIGPVLNAGPSCKEDEFAQLVQRVTKDSKSAQGLKTYWIQSGLGLNAIGASTKKSASTALATLCTEYGVKITSPIAIQLKSAGANAAAIKSCGKT
jgi:uncharacterized protein YjbI with pentapeptide repeats